MNNASQKLSRHRLHPGRSWRRATWTRWRSAFSKRSRRLQKDGPTEEERELAVTKAESDHATAYETSDGVAGAYGITIIQASLDNELRYLDRLKDHHARTDPGGGAEIPVHDRLRLDCIRAPEGAMIRRTLVLVAVLSLWIPASAPAEMAGVTRSKLPNGLTVIVRENAAAPIVAYSLLVKMGTRNETTDNAGISNMLQLMLVRGTEKMSGEQIAATADRLGGSIDAYGDADYSEITATALSRNWQPMLEMVADVALRPTDPGRHGHARCATSWSGRSGIAARSPTTSRPTRCASPCSDRPSLRLGPDRAQRVRASV